MKLGGHSTKRAAVSVALFEYIKLCRRRELLALRGRVRWDGSLELMRKNRFS